MKILSDEALAGLVQMLDRVPNDLNAECFLRYTLPLVIAELQQARTDIAQLRAGNLALGERLAAASAAITQAAERERLRADEVRGLLVKLKEYAIHHGTLIGECVAWNRLKELYGVEELYAQRAESDVVTHGRKGGF